MNSITFRTLPFTNSQRQRVIDISADVTPLAGRKESVNLMDMASVPFTFVLKHVDKLIPASIGNGLSKMIRKEVDYAITTILFERRRRVQPRVSG